MKVKVIKEIPVEDGVVGVLECEDCHWKFIGDCERHGHDFTIQSVDTPNFCPMCGTKIEGVIE